MNGTFTPDHSQALEIRWQRGWQHDNPVTYDSPYTTHRLIGWLLVADDDGDPYEIRPVATDEIGCPMIFAEGQQAGRWKLHPTTAHQPLTSKPKSTTARWNAINIRTEQPCRPLIRQGGAV